MIQGLYETHLNVSDLERSMAFYGDVLGLPFAMKETERRVAFYWIGEPKQNMLGLWEKPAEQVLRSHFAFHISQDDMHNAVAWLNERGIKTRNFLNDGIERPMVFSWMPAVAIYFADPDSHSLEFITILNDSPKPELGVISWEDWEQANGRA